MRKPPATLLGLACAATASGADPPVLAVRAARLLDVKTGRYVEKPVVVVAGDRIERVGADFPSGARVIGLGDRTLLPGLADVHTHILLQADATSAEYLEQFLKEDSAPTAAPCVRPQTDAHAHG